MQLTGKQTGCHGADSFGERGTGLCRGVSTPKGKIGKPLGTNLGTNRGLSNSEVLQTKARSGRAGGI